MYTSILHFNHSKTPTCFGNNGGNPQGDVLQKLMNQCTDVRTS
jgi:hypothetical protein